MHVNWKHLAIGLAVLPVAAVLAAWIGFFNVGASSGHWKITDWFLHFAMRSAVRTYALAVEAPEQLPAEGIQPAAGHYAHGCAMCHGAPGEARSPAVLAMLPAPPDLSPQIPTWGDAELFRIVKHGIRFSGMPAWPTQARDDEVWSMVAFLRELPTMEPQRYRDLAHGGTPPIVTPAGTAFDAVLGDCARCHGKDGAGRAPLTPRIGGQREAYLAASLVAYRERARASGFMSLPATGLSDADIAALAKHFASQPAAPAQREGDVEAGRLLAEHGDGARAIPACLSCHRAPDRNPLYPSLDGQNAAYLAAQLRLFHEGKRGGTKFAHLMVSAARHLEEADIEALAAYFAARPRQ